jgi:hypothetical protein
MCVFMRMCECAAKAHHQHDKSMSDDGFSSNDHECAKLTDCIVDQHVSVAHTATTDRTCTAHTVCTEHSQYETKAAGPSNNRCSAVDLARGLFANGHSIVGSSCIREPYSNAFFELSCTPNQYALVVASGIIKYI